MRGMKILHDSVWVKPLESDTLLHKDELNLTIRADPNLFFMGISESMDGSFEAGVGYSRIDTVKYPMHWSFCDLWYHGPGSRT